MRERTNFENQASSQTERSNSNPTEAAHEGKAFRHQLFEDQAARTPEAVAMVFEDGTLTYGELDCPYPNHRY